MSIMRKEVELSARMQAIADLVTPGNVVCDVGCDHGFLSIYLVQSKISPRVIAMDVRSGPLARCAEHVAQYGLEQYITMRLSDGLEHLQPGEAEALVCAGMGGRLMQRILTEGSHKASGLKEMILQPQSELKAFREFLRKQGYRTVEENMIEEDGKFYPMMKVVPHKLASAVEKMAVSDTTAGVVEKMAVSEPSGTVVKQEDGDRQISVYDRFGKQLLIGANPVLYRFLKQREAQLLGIRENILGTSHTGAPERLCEIDCELTDISEAFKYYK